jgi:acyl-coenzyme A synthetase/AMP-(fatty) acid ligase
VPIGFPFDGMHTLIVDEQLREVEDGMDGELLMTGPQLSLGYWQDGEKTRRAFVQVNGREGTYYRTGDRVRRPAVNKPLVYLGRLDNQIKVLGHRVELGELETTVRQLSGLEGVVAVGWPRTESGADGIEVFLETAEGFDIKALAMQLKETLPAYMLPRNILVLNRFPLNANGKYDRKALLLTLEKKFGSAHSRAPLPRSAREAPLNGETC